MRQGMKHCMRYDIRRRCRGFTFIELMMSLAILGVMAMVAVPMAQHQAQRLKERELRRSLTEIRDAIDRYKRAAEQGRIRLQIGESGYPSRLEDLVEGIVDQRSPAGQSMFFLRRLPRDPFHPDAAAKPADTWGLRSHASPPDAPAAGADVFDVLSISGRVGLNGVPYAQW